MSAPKGAAPVDLLAVLDRGIADLMEGHATMWTARDVIVMRDVVARLVEVAGDAADRLDDADRSSKALRAALAPFQTGGAE